MKQKTGSSGGGVIISGRIVFIREIAGLMLIGWAIYLLLALLSFDPNDPGFNRISSGSMQVRNFCGQLGAYISGLAVDLFGIASYVWPAAFLSAGLSCFAFFDSMPWWRWMGFFLTGTCLVVFGAEYSLYIGEVSGGGIFGQSLYSFGDSLLSGAANLFWIFLLFFALELAFSISWLDILRRLLAALRGFITDIPLGEMTDFFRDTIQEWNRRQNREHSQKNTLLQDNSDSSLRQNAPEQLAASQGEDRSEQVPHTAVSDDAEQDRSLSELLLGTQSVEYDSSPAIQDAAPSLQGSQDPLPDFLFDNSAFSQNSVSSREEKTSDNDLLTGVPGFIRDLEGDPSECVSEPADIKEDFQNNKDQNESLIREAEPGVDTVTTDQRLPEQPIPASVSVPVALTAVAPSVPATPSSAASPQHSGIYLLPPADFLSLPQESDSLPSDAYLQKQGQTLMQCLEDFGIQGELVRATPGPVVTLFEIRPATGVRVGRFTNLSDDFARVLRAEAIRIQAPVPGCDTVGIEIPNPKRSTVNFRTIISSPNFQNSQSVLSMALGKTIDGSPAVRDLAAMPHMLVGGTTGSGKSVCLNSVLISFLYKASPRDLRLLLIDPKRVEMTMYSGLPHLVHPVVTETDLAKSALEWAVREMEARYVLLSRLEVKNITGYNRKLLGMGAKRPPELADLQPLPYIVIVIDELADLMMTAGKEIESRIVRLAQLARAAGIHLIVATQRPSVDVVTGLIKANFPCRISFKVSNKYDSRTILDETGAEKLLGMGDMLFRPGDRIQRLHGPFVSDDEVQAVVDYWKKQCPTSYIADFQAIREETEESGSGSGTPMSDSDDPLYSEAVEFARERGNVSISLLQRRFRIGFNKAARFREQLEKDGVISSSPDRFGRTH
ncbi:MAG: DNA translocase FtsK 4TM domain-containing protein [Desulfovibrionaceae bacterium]|nr:DNA translocase FtsK 4TM domain-containing protein [Desulfovibrionaceae bacterium]